MGTDQSRPPDGGAADRLEAQRKAFGALLARITADRDALITAVQETKQQLNVLAARVEGGPVSSPAALAAAFPGGGPLEEVKGWIAELRQEQRDAVARTLATAEHATLRADEALRRLEELAAEQPACAAPAVSQPLDDDRTDAMRAWAEQFERVQREAVAQAVARAHEEDRRIEELAATLQRHSELLAAAEERLDEAGARQLRRLDALYQLVEQANVEQRRATTEASAAAQRALERADDAVLHLEELIAAQAARAAQAAERTGRADAERETLAAAAQAQGEQLTALAARVEEGEAASAARLDALRRLVEEAGTTHGQAAAVAQQALERADAAAGRVEELIAAQAAAAAQATGVEAEREARAAAAQAQGEQLTALAARVDEGQAAYAAQLEALRQLVEQVQRDQRQAAAQLSATGEHALFRAEEACRRIEELTVAPPPRSQGEELVALRSATDRLTADLRIERIEPVAPVAASAAPADDTVAELAQRVGGLEAQLNALRQATKDAPPALPVAAAPAPDEAAGRTHHGGAGRRVQDAVTAAQRWLLELPRLFQPRPSHRGVRRSLWRTDVREVWRAFLGGRRPRPRARDATQPSPYAASPRPAIAAAGLVVATLGVALAIGWQTSHLQPDRAAESAAPSSAPPIAPAHVASAKLAAAPPASHSVEGLAPLAASTNAGTQTETHPATGQPVQVAAAQGFGQPLTFSTRLSVETSFAGVPAIDVVRR
jgi:colicin import membrane protein